MSKIRWGEILKYMSCGVKYLILIAVVYIGIGVKKIDDNNELQSQQINRQEKKMTQMEEKIEKVERKLNAQDIENKEVRAALEKLKDARKAKEQ